MKEVFDRARALIAEASNPDRLYPLLSHDCYGFYTGRLPTGEQAIVFWDNPAQVAILRFDIDGDYLGAEVRPMAPLPELPRTEPFRGLKVQEYFRNVLGFVWEVVRVKQFFEERWKVGIRPVDDIHEEFAADPISFCDGDSEDFENQLEYLRSWVADRQFVFDYGNNFCVDDQGEVVSS